MKTTGAQIIRFVSGKRYRPMTIREMAVKLKVPKQDRPDFAALIDELKLAGELVEVKQKQLADPDRVDLVVGTLLCNPRGFGFINPAREKDGEDVYVHGSNMSSAMHGDIVVARRPRPSLKRRTSGPGRRRQSQAPDVKIISVLKRARTHVVGTFFKTRKVAYVVPDDARLFRDLFVAMQDENGARHGDKVKVSISTWPSRHINPTGEVEDVFGPRGQLDAERLSVVHAYGLRLKFPKQVLRSVNQVPTRVTRAEFAGREDLRSEQIITIDPDDARDFDDAVSIGRNKAGEWELAVHIADVTHYVKPDDPIDLEARVRSTSVYLPGQVIPMLPEALSNNICSLRPNKVRLTKTVRLWFNNKGRLLRTRLCKSVIKSALRLTYKEALAVINGGNLQRKEAPLRKQLLQMHELAQLLRKRRARAGMLNIEIPEPHIITDKTGATIGIELQRNDDAHRLIEQFMLIANESVANFLLENELPYLCRAHPEPAPKAIREFRDTVRSLGYNLPSPGTRQQIRRFIKSIEGKSEAPALHVLLLRSMKPAEYSAEDRPHYAIGVAHYLHFTSPIRRYADLLAHRILDEHWSGALASEKHRAEWKAFLPARTAHASRTERNAESAERTITLRRMKDFIATQKEPMKAIILAAESYGMRVQLRESLVEGVVHMASLTDGFYRVDRKHSALVGPRGRTYKVGDMIKVRVRDFDELKHQIEFEPVP